MKQRCGVVSVFFHCAAQIVIASLLLFGRSKVRANEYVWESMGGPPGGGVIVLAKNPYMPRDLYAGASPGLFVSHDNGTAFRRVSDPTLTEVSGIEFSENFAVVTADKVYSYDYRTEAMQVLLDTRAKTFLHGEDLYVIAYTQADNKVDLSVFRINRPDPSMQIDLEALAALATISIDVPAAEPQLYFDVVFPSIMMLEDSLLFTVGLIGGPDTYARHEIIVVDVADGSWRFENPGLPADLVPAKIAQYPADPQHLILGARSRKSGDVEKWPISELLYESNDGGKTWNAFTTNTSYQFNMIKDIKFHAGRIYFARVDDWILSVDQNDHSSWEHLGMPMFGTGLQSVAWLAWLQFDSENANIVFGGLDLEAGCTGLIRSGDGMETWEIVGSGIPSSQPSNIDIHPYNGDILVTSGNIAHYPHITRDGGQTWERLLEATSMGDELVFDPHNPNHLVLVSELSDLFQTWDMGRGWGRLSERFHAARILDLAASNDGSGRLFASLLGIGLSQFGDLNKREEILSGPEARFQWEHMYGSSDYAYDIALDPEDSRVLYASYSPKLFETHASIFRYDGSTDEAGAWETVLSVENAAGISSMVIDPRNRDRLYAGVIGENGRILTSSDRGENWVPLCEDLTFSTIHEMAVDPTNDSVVYAAPWGGGLFKTADAGITWTALNIPTVSVASIVVDPENPQHIYIGDRTRPYVFETHDGGGEWVPTVHLDRDMLYRVSSMTLHQGALIVSVFNRVDKKISLFDEGPMSGATFKLRDGHIEQLHGEMTRAAIGLVSTGENLYAVSHIRGVFRLDDNAWIDVAGNLPDMGFNSISADNSGNLYLAGGCDVSLYRTLRIDDPAVVNNIYRSSDAGETWEPLLEGNPLGGSIKKVLAHPVEQNKLFAGTQNGIFLSTDHGRTWSEQNNGLSFVNIGALALGRGKTYAGTLGGGVFAGTVGSNTVTWSGAVGPTPDLYNIRIVLDPANSQVIYATAYPGGVFKSTDGGATWAECNFGLPSFQVIDPFMQGYYDLAVHPENPNILWLGIYDHGIYVSRDGAATWVPTYAVNPDEPVLRGLKTKRVAFDPTNPNHVYVASEEGMFFTPNLGGAWEALNEGLDTRDIISLEISEDGSVFAGSNGYGVYCLNKHARTWTHMNRTTGFGQWAPWERRLYMYIALLFDPTVPGRIYLGNFPAGFFVSNDDGQSWQCSSLGLGNDGIFSLTMHPENPQLIFAGTYNGVWKTENQGASWSQTSNGMPGEQWPFCVVIDDQNPSVMYTATKNGMNKGFMSRNEFGGVVMKSVDGAQSWFKIMEGLPTMSEYYQLIIHPEDHDRLFVSSSFGVFTSNDAGASWEPFNEGLPVEHFYIRDNVAENLKITPDSKYLVLGITAHGVWRVNIANIVEN